MVNTKAQGISKVRNQVPLTSKRKRKSTIILFLLIGFGLLTFYISWLNHTPSSTLASQIVTDVKKPTEELCKGEHQLHPPTSWKWPFPASSPDGKYYIDISDVKLGKIMVLKLFDSETQKEVGRYYSSYPSLKVYCWADDSSGIYVADYKPVWGYGGIFTPSPETGPVKKLLVPE